MAAPGDGELRSRATQNLRLDATTRRACEFSVRPMPPSHRAADVVRRTPSSRRPTAKNREASLACRTMRAGDRRRRRDSRPRRCRPAASTRWQRSGGGARWQRRTGAREKLQKPAAAGAAAAAAHRAAARHHGATALQKIREENEKLVKKITTVRPTYPIREYKQAHAVHTAKSRSPSGTRGSVAYAVRIHIEARGGPQSVPMSPVRNWRPGCRARRRARTRRAAARRSTTWRAITPRRPPPARRRRGRGRRRAEPAR